MSFNSLAFLIFLPIVILIYWIIPFKFRKYFLLLASYFCYGYFSFWLLLLMIGISSTSYFSALLLSKESISKRKKQVIFVSTITIILSILFIFKYLDFVYSNICNLINIFGTELEVASLNIILPIGISFYTFQTLSYVIDVYKGNYEVEKDFIYYSLFVSFFPQLVAGPIERPSNLLPQLKEDKKFNCSFFIYGSQELIIGFTKKIVVADVLAIFVDAIYQDLNSASGLLILLASMLFYFQIFADFSGYSDIAKGSAALLGINLSENFKEPYKATSIKDFWRRWHITLTSWLTDYIYIPLGGNRNGSFRKYLNIFVVFLVSGIWHGANRTFILWGALNGLLLILYNVLAPLISKNSTNNKKYRLLFKVLSTCFTFILMSFLWIIFRAQTIQDVGIAFSRIFTSFIYGTGYDLFKDVYLITFIVLSIILLLNIKKLPKLYDKSKAENQEKLGVNVLLYLSLIFLIGLTWIYLLETKGESGFIYFQF